MIRSYIKIAWRNLWQNKVYSFINIGGLAMGIAAFLLILQYVGFERSVNAFHTQLPNMYRILNLGQKGETWAETEPGWAPRLQQNFPEVKSYCRVAEGIGKGIVSRNGSSEVFRENGVGYVESNFFDFFTFRVLEGEKSQLKQPATAFLTPAAAKKYFGKEKPVGKTFVLANQFGSLTYRVAGLFEIPSNSDIRFDIVLSLETLRSSANRNNNDWADLDSDSQYLSTFLVLGKGTNVKALETKMTDFRTRLNTDKDGVSFRLQPLAHMHLAENLGDTYQTTGNLKYVYILLVVAVMILSIAWFNYINLSTARALKRAGEVGVRKVIGATSGNLITQFLGESFLVNFLSFGLALLMVVLVQPFFNRLVGVELTLSTLANGSVPLVGLLVLIAGILLSGAYTAYTLANFNPVQVMKGSLNKAGKGVWLRKTLVISQFTISIVLIMVTMLIYNQLRFMQGQDLGMKPEQLLVIRGPVAGQDTTFKNRQAGFQEALKEQSFVSSYALSGTVPGSWYNFTTSGFTQPASVPGDELKSYSFAIIGKNFLNTYGISLVAGRTFTDQETQVDWNANSKVLLNERALGQLGFKNPEDALHTRIKWDERYLDVIGVVKDYHHLGLQQAIQPVIFYPQNSNSYITVKITPERIGEKLASLEGMYKHAFPGNPFEYFFVDENFNKQYAAEQQYGKIFTTASSWAIVIACMGLFGLATFTVESRTKEIGIRKVLGASVGSIVTLLSSDFLKLVVIAMLVACPIAWYFMHDWLKDFEYKVTVSWWLFAAGGGLAAIVALLTVSFQSVRAAVTNPVKSLKTE